MARPQEVGGCRERMLRLPSRRSGNRARHYRNCLPHVVITPASGRSASSKATLHGDTTPEGMSRPIGHKPQGSGAPPRMTNTTANNCDPFTHSRSVSRTPCKRRDTCSVAVHPIRRDAPDPSRYTRSVAVHPFRRGAPDQKGCNAYGSGAAPHR